MSAGSSAGMGGLGRVIIVILGAVFGFDIRPFFGDAGGLAPQTAGVQRELSDAELAAGDFAARVLATTEEVLAQVLPAQAGQACNPPDLILFSGATRSACGGAFAATGPFYCQLDRGAYLDTEFFATMSQELGARGDVAAACVIAHEVAHHVQNELGILPQVQGLQRQVRQAEANELSVRLELKAD